MKQQNNNIIVASLSLITPRACARGKAVGFVCLLSVVVTKIARSPHLGIWATRKYDESVEIGDKLVSLCFELIGKAYECHKYCVFVGHAYRLQAVCDLLMRTSPKNYVGKDRQHNRVLEQVAMQINAGYT